MEESTLIGMLKPQIEQASSKMELDNGSKIAVIGGGPAGSFFSIFLLDMATMMDLDIQVDIFEPRDFSKPGPVGCNMCGGIISESLVQMLATDGINLPPTIVQRGIESYVLHMDVGSVRIETPLHEKRIGAVHRGAGPRDLKEIKWGSFDGHLQSLAVEKGANIISKRVSAVNWDNRQPQVSVRGSEPKTYDLLAVSVGVNSNALKLFQNLEIEYEPPQTTKTFIREFYLGEEKVDEYFGNSMHVFLLEIPKLEFAAIIPKGDYASLCLLGDEIDKELIEEFLDSPEVVSQMPPDLDLSKGSCQCSPRISVKGSARPFADRIVFIGDSGVTRLYKDGIGAAYCTSKAAASTAIFQGVTAKDFENHYWPQCQRISTDNRIGKIVFLITQQIQQRKFSRQALLRMVSSEQQLKGSKRRMSSVLWDTFTGSARYQEIFLRTFHPAIIFRFIWDNVVSIITMPLWTPRKK